MICMFLKRAFPGFNHIEDDNFSFLIICLGYKVCPFTGGGYGRENVSPDSTTIDPNR